MGKVFDIKWQKDLINHISAFTTFAFEGNVNDLQPVPKGDAYEYVALQDCIAKLLAKDYCVVFYDHKKRGVSKIDEPTEEEKKEEEENLEACDEAFNSFSFFEKSVISSTGERIPNPNIELFKRYFSEAFANTIRDDNDTALQGSVTVDMKRIHDAMKDYGDNVKAVQEEESKDGFTYRKTVFKVVGNDEAYKETKPFLFIIPDLSRFMTNPGAPNTPENSILMTLFDATVLDNTPARLVIAVDKINDLPTWFEAEGTNPSIKKVFIPVPNSTFRGDFFDLEIAPIMQNSEGNSKGKKKFVAYTDKYSLKKLVQLKRYIQASPHNEDRNLNRIDKTVFAFEFGINENPWMNTETFKNITNLKKTIATSIQGQDHIVDSIQKALQSAVTGVNTTKSNDRRPKAVFFLAGPTGTGKTEMCRQLAEVLFGKEDKMIRFDMSEFKEPHNQSRLFGAPPGYMGYNNGGELTKAVKESPFSLLLFDEIEKAHPSIWDKFLQILGDGRVTDGKGETVYFSETVIVFTSNLGITSTLKQDEPNNILMYEAARKNLDNLYAEYMTLQNDTDKKTCLDKMHKPLVQIVDYEGISIKTSKEKYFSLLADFTNNVAWECFSQFVSDVVKDRISSYFESISRREVLGRIGQANIMVYKFINEPIAVRIMDVVINKFVDYLKTDNAMQLDLVVSSEAREEIAKRVKDPSVLDLGGRGISMTTEKIISTAVGEYLFKIGQDLMNDNGSLATDEIYKGELVYRGGEFIVIDRQ